MTESIQTRTSSELKKDAINILEQLEIEERVSEVTATMSLEGMNLSDEEKDTLRLYTSGKVSGDELRHKIIEETQSE